MIASLPRVVAMLSMVIRVATASPAAAAQASAGGVWVAPNASYDGRFTFARLRYDGFGCATNEGPGWHHDYPVAERNLATILAELTTTAARVDSSVVFSPDDPELLKYPIAYLSEPGCWTMSKSEVIGLRQYLQKGGFLIVDDFRGNDWENFADQMARVLPEGKLVPIRRSDPVFNNLFELENAATLGPSGFGTEDGSSFQGIYERNDPTRRLLVIANYNLDIGDYWQWSPTDLVPIGPGNEAYKFGVNYILYGLTR